MGIFDYPVGDGTEEHAVALLDSVAAFCTSPESHVAIETSGSSEESEWVLARLRESRSIEPQCVFVLEREDPFSALHGLWDLEDSNSLHQSKPGTLIVVKGLHHLSDEQQIALVSATRAVCGRRRSKVLFSGEASRTAFRAPSEDFTLIEHALLPQDSEKRVAIVQEILRQSFAREKVRLPESRLVSAAAAIAELPLPKGFWQVDSLASAAARRFAVAGVGDVSAVIRSVAEQAQERQLQPITSQMVQNQLRGLEGRVQQLNDTAVKVDGRQLVTLRHLPAYAEMCSSPQHWFSAVVARWYAFCFDGGPRLSFLNRLEVRVPERLIVATHMVSALPLLLQALRTWQAHGLDTTTQRAQQQRSRIDSWYASVCGTAIPKPSQWRLLTMAVASEIEAYLKDLTLCTGLLRRHAELIQKWHDWERAELGRR